MRTSFIPSRATLTLVFSGLSAQAETIDYANTGAIAPVDAQRLSLQATEPQSNSGISIELFAANLDQTAWSNYRKAALCV